MVVTKNPVAHHLGTKLQAVKECHIRKWYLHFI